MSKWYKAVCPICKSNNVVPIEYGFPGFEMKEEAMRGKIHLGGCMIMEDNPEWHCKACHYEWQTDHPHDGRVIFLECGEIEEDCLCE